MTTVITGNKSSKKYVFKREQKTGSDAVDVICSMEDCFRSVQQQLVKLGRRRLSQVRLCTTTAPTHDFLTSSTHQINLEVFSTTFSDFYFDNKLKLNS